MLAATAKNCPDPECLEGRLAMDYNGIWGVQPSWRATLWKKGRFWRGTPFNSGKFGMTVQPILAYLLHPGRKNLGRSGHTT